jgi:hypothetical protein
LERVLRVIEVGLPLPGPVHPVCSRTFENVVDHLAGGPVLNLREARKYLEQPLRRLSSSLLGTNWE